MTANPPSSIQLLHATPATPGAIAILQLVGEGCEVVLEQLAGRRDWPVGRVRLVDFAGIDEGLAVRLTPDVAQIMPHGGLRVVQRITAKLRELGVRAADDQEIDPLALYPEAADRIEALMLLTLSRAASPLAIDALLAQPERWRAAMRDGVRPRKDGDDGDVRASMVLNRLITPPVVSLFGRPNVGKSTLSNALLGRTMSIAADVPGTTRDYVAGRIDLGGLVVDWHDTPGVRTDAEAIERKAIDIAGRLLARADLVIAMRDAERDWPEIDVTPHVWVVNKVDDAAEDAEPARGMTAANPLRISARNHRGLAELVSTIREQLVPSAIMRHRGLWKFDARLGGK